MGRSLRAVVAVLVAVPLASCGTAGVTGDKAGGQRGPAPVIVTLGHAVTEAELRTFIDEVSRLSHGSVRVVPHGIPLTDSGDDNAAVLANMTAGRADLGVVSADSVPWLDALTAPMAIDSLTLQQRVLQSGLPAELGLGQDYRWLGLLPGPLVWPASTGRALLGPNDLRGKRIAMPPSESATRYVAALGATPVPHNLRGADVTAFDAMAAPLPVIAQNLYDGTATTLTTNLVLGARPLVVVGRPGPHTDLLRAAATAAIPATTEFRRAEQAAAITALCRRGRITFVTATGTDLVAQRISEVQGQFARDAVKEIRAMRVGEADVPTCRGIGGQTMRTFLDGEYEVTTTGGAFHITLDRGNLGGDWAHGTYLVNGDVLTMNSSRDPEPISYRWNLYGDELTLFPVTNQHSPLELRAKPWRRIGDAPVADPTPIDGVYEVSTSEGRYRWTLDRGQLDQTRNGPDTWASGAYTISGDILTITYAQSGGEPLTSEHIKPGDSIVYRWNRYRGQLRLSAAAAGNSPPVFIATWRRVGDAP